MNKNKALTLPKGFDYQKLLDLNANRIGAIEELPAPTSEEELQSAMDYRKLGALAQALSGAVRSAGAVGGKMPTQTSPNLFESIGKMPLEEIGAKEQLRKSQEEDIYSAIERSGLIEQERQRQERLDKPFSQIERSFINKKLKDIGVDIPLPDDIVTRRQLEEYTSILSPYLFETEAAGLTPYQAAMLGISGRTAAATERRTDIQELLAGLKSAEQSETAEWRKRPVDEFTRRYIAERMKEIDPTFTMEDIPPDLTNGDLRRPPYSNIMGNKPVTSGKMTKAQQEANQLRRIDQQLRQDKLTSQQAKISQVSQKVLDDIRAIDVTIQSLDRIEQLKKKVPTGPLDTTVGKLGSLIKGGLGRPIDQDRKMLEQEVGVNLVNYVFELSGKASTDRERQALEGNLPTMMNNDNEFLIKTKNLRDILMRKRNIIEQEQQYLNKGIPPLPRTDSLFGQDKDLEDIRNKQIEIDTINKRIQQQAPSATPAPSPAPQGAAPAKPTLQKSAETFQGMLQPRAEDKNVEIGQAGTSPGGQMMAPLLNNETKRIKFVWANGYKEEYDLTNPQESAKAMELMKVYEKQGGK